MIFISDVVLYLLSEGWKKSLIFDGTISFQDLKMAVFMHDTTFSESGSLLSESDLCDSEEGNTETGA